MNTATVVSLTAGVTTFLFWLELHQCGDPQVLETVFAFLVNAVIGWLLTLFLPLTVPWWGATAIAVVGFFVLYIIDIAMYVYVLQADENKQDCRY